jgi:hypothetical protein
VVAEDLFLPDTNAMQTQKAISVDESEVGDAKKFAFNEKTARDMALHKALKVYKHQLKKQWKQEYPGYEQDNYRRNDCSEIDALHNPVGATSTAGAGKFGKTYAKAPRKAVAAPIGHGLEPEEAAAIPAYNANDHPVARTKSYSIDGQGMKVGKVKGGFLAQIGQALSGLSLVPTIFEGFKWLVDKIQAKRAAKKMANDPLMNRQYQEMMAQAYKYRRPRPEDVAGIQVQGSGDFSPLGQLHTMIRTIAHEIDKGAPGKGMEAAKHAVDAKVGAGFADWVIQRQKAGRHVPKVLKYKHFLAPMIKYHLMKHPEYQKDPRYGKAMKRFLAMSPLFHKKVAHGYGLFDMLSTGLGQVMNGIASHISDPGLLQVIGDAAPYLHKGIASVGSAASKFPGHKLFAAAAPAMFGTAATYMISKATAPLRANHPEEAALVSGLMKDILKTSGIGGRPEEFADLNFDDVRDPTPSEITNQREIFKTMAIDPKLLTDEYVAKRIKLTQLMKLRRTGTAKYAVKEDERKAKMAEKLEYKKAKKTEEKAKKEEEEGSFGVVYPKGALPAHPVYAVKPGQSMYAPKPLYEGVSFESSFMPGAQKVAQTIATKTSAKAAKKAAKEAARMHEIESALRAENIRKTVELPEGPSHEEMRTIASREYEPEAGTAPDVAEFWKDEDIFGSGLKRDSKGRYLPKNKQHKVKKGGAVGAPHGFNEFHGATIPTSSIIDGLTVGHSEEIKAAAPPGALVMPSANTKNLYYQNRLKNPKAGSVFKLSKKIKTRS